MRIGSGSNHRGMTLVEMLVGVALSSVVFAMITVLWVYSARAFASLGNYTELDSSSRYAVDCILREIREATQVIGFQSTGTNNWLQLTNAQSGCAIRYSWDSITRTLIRQKTSEADVVYLTGCDFWDSQIFQRTPQTNGTYLFYPATNASGVYDPSLCKLINLSWKCSRTMLSQKLNTENVQTAQVVLRNKQ